MRYWICFLFIIPLLNSCTNDCENEVDLSDVQLEMSFERVDLDLLKIKSRKDAKEFVSSHPELVAYYKTDWFPNDSIVTDYLMFQSTDASMKALAAECQKYFENPTRIENGLDSLFRHVKYYYPDYTPPKVHFLFGGYLGIDLMLFKDNLFIGQEFFQPDKSNPMHVAPQYPMYILEHFVPEKIPVKTSQLVSTRFNEFDKSDQTLVASMIYYGKAFYFTEKMIPCIADSNVVEWSSQQLEWAHTFEKKIWSHFLQNELFFKEDRAAFKKYVDHRPKVNEVADECPGRIGQWLGWQIVRAYMDSHKEVSLQELMLDNDAQKIFREARYKPRNLNE